VTALIKSFKQVTSLLRTFGLKETLRRALYYSASVMFGEKLYQKPIIDCIVKHAKGYPTFIDIGAYRGIITIAVSNLFEQCIAIEPIPENFLYLLHNVSIHGVKNCILLPLALGEEPGVKMMYYNPLNPDTASLLPSSSPRSLKRLVKVGTLDGVIKMSGAKDPYLIKIDVQGYEFKVMKGGKETLKKECLIISEFWPFGLRSAGDNPLQYIQFMKELGYQVCNLQGLPLAKSELSRLCLLGLRDPFIVTDILFVKRRHP